jgi:GTP pyrophosphokinase
MYRYKADRVRDWVNYPKNNGYEALHCTLMSSTGIWVEVQIRTQRMNEIAEKGIAAHWAYKKGGEVTESESEMDKWITRIKEILVNPDVTALDLLDMIHNDLLTADIMVFTPKGEQKSIEKGATALDFAYAIHSEIGNKAIAAKVNFKLAPLSYVLKTGDQIEIITAENENPKREWLQFVKTSKARKFIQEYLKTQRQTTEKLGKLMLEEALLQIGRELTDKVVKSLMEEFDIFDTKPEEMYYKIGNGEISLDGLSEKLQKYHGINRESYFVISNSDSNQKYILASCCTPIMGESVLGFRDSDGVITVHTRTCPNANNLAAKFGDQIVAVKWDQEANSANTYLARVSLKGTDRIGMINDITRITSKVLGVNIRRFNLGAEEGIFEGFIDLYVQNIAYLEKLITRLQKIKGIDSVVKTDL